MLSVGHALIQNGYTKHLYRTAVAIRLMLRALVQLEFIILDQALGRGHSVGNIPGPKAPRFQVVSVVRLKPRNGDARPTSYANTCLLLRRPYINRRRPAVDGEENEISWGSLTLGQLTNAFLDKST